MRLIILSGLSGAGKTQALKRLEDFGFFCVDNLPCEMCAGFVELCSRAVPPVERAAVVIDSREHVFSHGIENMLDTLDGMGVQYTIVFLDCRDEILEMRYNETRRKHPLSADVREGIRRERELLSHLRDKADYIIDTTSLRPLELGASIREIVAKDSEPEFSLSIMSFGYKRGVPFEADIVVDMRFSPNPYYEKELRSLSGRDEAVRKFVFADKDVQIVLDDLEATIKRLAPRFAENDKRRLMVAFGCTGGRHRSVCAAEELFKRLKGKYSVSLIHRDLESEGDEIKERTGERR